ncbi:MAG TPA: hypothetical protein VK395_38080 [Gemmataceae bacterium]|nr:hypothetical protein [Gemmataceae bacterium]
MTAIKGVVKNGRIELATPPDWPEGCEVIIEPVRIPTEKIGLDESEWRDDAESLADWDAWIQTLQPLELTPAEEAAFARFDDRILGQFENKPGTLRAAVRRSASPPAPSAPVPSASQAAPTKAPEQVPGMTS